MSARTPFCRNGRRLRNARGCVSAEGILHLVMNLGKVCFGGLILIGYTLLLELLPGKIRWGK